MHNYELKSLDVCKKDTKLLLDLYKSMDVTCIESNLVIVNDSYIYLKSLSNNVRNTLNKNSFRKFITLEKYKDLTLVKANVFTYIVLPLVMTRIISENFVTRVLNEIKSHSNLVKLISDILIEIINNIK